MTIWIALGLILMTGALVCMFMAGKEGSPRGVIFSIFLLSTGLFTFAGNIVDNYKGYASDGCETGTYRLSTVDDSNDTKLYITVRDYKDYALRLCSIEKKNVHVTFSYYLTYIDGKVTRPKNVRLSVGQDGFRHLYPAE